MSHPDGRHWQEILGLVPHPEGGRFREMWRSPLTLEVPGMGPRLAGTAILYLLAAGQVSRLHRLRSDEVWHHYTGCDLLLHLLEPGGGYRSLRLGTSGKDGARPQAVVPAECWFGASPADPEGWALVGCTMAPGFDFADFEMGSRQELLARYPDHQSLIELLTEDP